MMSFQALLRTEIFQMWSCLFFLQAPNSLHNVGHQLLAKITLRYGGSQRFFSKDQQKGTSSSMLYEAVSPMEAEIEICNEAGCSSKIQISCALKETPTKKGNL